MLVVARWRGRRMLIYLYLLPLVFKTLLLKWLYAWVRGRRVRACVFVYALELLTSYATRSRYSHALTH